MCNVFKARCFLCYQHRTMILSTILLLCFYCCCCCCCFFPCYHFSWYEFCFARAQRSFFRAKNSEIVHQYKCNLCIDHVFDVLPGTINQHIILLLKVACSLYNWMRYIAQRTKESSDIESVRCARIHIIHSIRRFLVYNTHSKLLHGAHHRFWEWVLRLGCARMRIVFANCIASSFGLIIGWCIIALMCARFPIFSCILFFFFVNISCEKTEIGFPCFHACRIRVPFYHNLANCLFWSCHSNIELLSWATKKNEEK